MLWIVRLYFFNGNFATFGLREQIYAFAAEKNVYLIHMSMRGGMFYLGYYYRDAVSILIVEGAQCRPDETKQTEKKRVTDDTRF